MPGTIETQQLSDGQAPAVRGVYLLTHPRSASNLFQTMMSKQPGYQNSGYKLFDAGFASLMQMAKGPLSEWEEEERKGLYGVFQAGFEKLQDELADAKKNGNKAFIKEHAIFLSGPDRIFSAVYPNDAATPPLTLVERDQPTETKHTNPTSLPDHFLLSLQPIFQIRHPILMFPSMIRAQRDGLKKDGQAAPRVSDYFASTTLTLRFTRELYDWYSAQSGPVPRIIDADDIMNDRDAVRKLCVQTGLNPDAVQYEWEERRVEDPLMARFLSTINASKGILPGLAAKGLDLQVEKEKWKKEFGDEDGEALARFVGDATGDYEYLVAGRTRGEGESL